MLTLCRYSMMLTYCDKNNSSNRSDSGGEFKMAFNFLTTTCTQSLTNVHVPLQDTDCLIAIVASSNNTQVSTAIMHRLDCGIVFVGSPMDGYLFCQINI